LKTNIRFTAPCLSPVPLTIIASGRRSEGRFRITARESKNWTLRGKRGQQSPMRALCLTLLGILFIAGCGASTSQQTSTAKKPEAATAPATEVAPAPKPEPAATETAAAPASLPPSLEAGEIRREALLKVLSAGPGRFLQRVKVARVLDDKGRFAGWQIVKLFPGESDVSSPFVPGDTLLRVNGQSVERPEQFKSLWDSLALSSELVLTVRRGGQQSDVRYRIVTEQLPQ
jgi:hypothetical protein